MGALFTRVRQFCTVVDDFEATIGHLVEHLGIGPFKCWHFRPPVLWDTTYGGAPAPYTMKLGITWLGDVQYEVIQPVEGRSVYRDHHDRHGRGVQHILMDTAPRSFERAAEELAARGLPFTQTARINPPLKLGRFTLPALPPPLSRPVNLHFGYIDAEHSLGAAFELTRYPLRIPERIALRLGKAEFAIPPGRDDFERDLPGLRVEAVCKATIVTRDVAETRAQWAAATGIRQWRERDRRDALATGRAALARIDDVVIELLEPTAGPYRELLDTRGEAIATLGVTPRGAPAALLAHCRALGYRVIADRGAGTAFLGARRWLGTDLELLPPGTTAASLLA